MRILKNIKISKFFFCIAIITISTLLCSSSQVQAQTQSGKYGNFYYTVTDGQLQITGYTADEVDVVIPSKIGSMDVTSIGDKFFSDNDYDVRSVTIPSSVTSIGYKAFEVHILSGSWNNLTSIYFEGNAPNTQGLSIFGDMGCNYLTVYYKAGAKGFDYQFCGVATAAFDNGTITSSLAAGGYTTIPPTLGGVNVTSIGDGAFSGCSGLISIIIPQGVTNIGDKAFYGCSGLTSISIPQGMASIGENAFQQCYGLTSITFNDAATAIYDGVNTIPTQAKIRGYAASTAQIYAAKYNRAFESIAPVPRSATISDINVPNGTALTNVGLPSTIQIILSDNSIQNVSVTWDSGTPLYSATTVGTYTFIGTLTMPPGMANPNNITATARVTVATRPVESVVLNKQSTILKVGDTDTLTATVLPSDATDKTVKWFSSDESVASVQNGIVEAKRLGTAVIRVTSESDITKYAGCTVNVIEPNPVIEFKSGIVMTKYDGYFNIKINRDKLPSELVNFTKIAVLGVPNIVDETINDSITETETYLYGIQVYDDTNGYNSSNSITDFYNIIMLLKDDNKVLGYCIIDKVKEFSVIFKDKTGRVLKSEKIAEGDDASPPDSPTLNGYEFIGWDKSFDKVTSDMVINATYIRAKDTYKVTVIGGKLSTGETSGDFRFDMPVTVVADSAPSKQKFSYWELDGKKISSDSTYTFFVPMKATTLTGVFVDKTTTLENKPFITLLDNVMVDITDKTMAFTATRVVPSGYSLVESGIILLKSSNFTGELTLDTANVIHGTIDNNSTNQFYVRKLNISDGDTWYARAYLIYKDANGNSFTVYSDNTVSRTMSGSK